MRSATWLGFTACLALAVATAAAQGPDERRVIPFKASSWELVRPPGLRVFQQSAPPPSDAEDESRFAYHPMTDAATLNVEALIASKNTRVRGWAWIWVNRANVIASNNPNPLHPPITVSPGVTAGVEYSSVAKADAATRAFLAYVFGRPAHDRGAGYADLANAGGIPDSDIVSWHDLNGAPAKYFTRQPANRTKARMVMLDKVWLPGAKLTQIARPNLKHGILLDFEVADGRSARQTTSLLSDLIKMSHATGYKVFVYNNPLDSVTVSRDSGLDRSNAGSIARMADLFGLEVHQDRQRGDIGGWLMKQAVVLGSPPPWSHIAVTVGIGSGENELPSAKARQVNEFIRAQRIPAVNIWPYYGRPGTPQYDRSVGLVTGILD